MAFFIYICAKPHFMTKRQAIKYLKSKKKELSKSCDPNSFMRELKLLKNNFKMIFGIDNEIYKELYTVNVVGTHSGGFMDENKFLQTFTCLKIDMALDMIKSGAYNNRFEDSVMEKIDLLLYRIWKTLVVVAFIVGFCYGAYDNPKSILSKMFRRKIDNVITK